MLALGGRIVQKECQDDPGEYDFALEFFNPCDVFGTIADCSRHAFTREELIEKRSVDAILRNSSHGTTPKQSDMTMLIGALSKSVTYDSLREGNILVRACPREEGEFDLDPRRRSVPGSRI